MKNVTLINVPDYLLVLYLKEKFIRITYRIQIYQQIPFYLQFLHTHDHWVIVFTGSFLKAKKSFFSTTRAGSIADKRKMQNAFPPIKQAQAVRCYHEYCLQ